MQVISHVKSDIKDIVITNSEVYEIISSAKSGKTEKKD